MKTSAAGRALIVAREGRRLVAYRDTRGILTIGVGHTGRMAPPPVSAGMRITEADCDAMLAADLAPVESVLNESVVVPMTQNEFDALASLGFNIGTGGLKRSSALRKLNLGDVSGAADAFMQWSRPAVLASRRAAERNQFLKPDAADESGVTPSARVAAARADQLAGRAIDKKSGVKAAQASGVVVAATGAAAAAVAGHAHHGHFAWLVGGLVAAGLALNGFVAWRRQRTAATLTTNAAAQARVAATLAGPVSAPVPPSPASS